MSSTVQVTDVHADAYNAGFDDIDQYRAWLLLEGRRQLTLSLRRADTRSDDQRLPRLVNTRRSIVLWCDGRDGKGDVAAKEKLQRTLDEIDRQYAARRLHAEVSDRCEHPLSLVLVSQIERAARVVQSVLRHVLAPSSVADGRSVGVPPVAVEEATAGGTDPGGST